MHIHIGERKTVSQKKLIGIFNAETLRLSEDNKTINMTIRATDKCVAVDINNNLSTSKVSPYTVMKRDSFTDEVIWSKK